MGFTFKKYRELMKELEKKREKRMAPADFATQKCGCVASALEIGMLKTAQGSLKNQVKLNSSVTFQPHMSSNV